MPERALLMVLDGFGCREDPMWNAVQAAAKPNLDALMANGAMTELATSGEDVGLPAGQMGNSEVGHMNIGAGRIIYQMLTRIDKSIRDGGFFRNDALVAAVRDARNNDASLHIMGLVSDGGVHSHLAHAKAVLALARREGLSGERVFIHAFTDGRDTSPTAGAAYVAELAEAAAESRARVATVSGRYFAMDRDDRWERTQLAWDAIVRAKGPRAADAATLLERSYAEDVTDEFVPPHVVLDAYPGVRDRDSVVFFNFRPDRARQLTRAFTERGFDAFNTGTRPFVRLTSFTRYDATFRDVPFAFSDDPPVGTLGEVVATAGLKQVRIAETEKYPHVTYFLNGGREAPFDGEERTMVPSPRDVPTYDHKPQMSAAGVTDAALAALAADAYHLIVMNYANCDMVGHTGDFDATVTAVETVDGCLGQVLAAAAAHGVHVFVTADHGNAEEMKNPDGSPQTAHTTLPVPFMYRPPPGVATPALTGGILADVAPTLLAVMGLPQPEGMTGRDLRSPP